MYKYEKEIEKILLKKESNMLDQLQRLYIRALADVKTRLRLLQAREETQSVIYQINYQTALETQLNAILDILNQDNITTITDFLEEMYETGYIGTQYALTQQGVPVVVSINQTEVAKSLFQKIEGMTFADRLNTNMNDFKRKVREEITRGIATGSTYRQIAQQLSLVTDESLKSSYRIARTEGHRVTSEAKLISGQKAKEQGADIVQMWDSTLDGKTRDNHRKLDGQWVEIGEYFSVDGKKVKAPGKFGRPEEDINCRCILLNRPRWAVDKRRVKAAKISDEYGNEVEKLIEVKNYDDYKKGYYKILNDDPEIEETIRRANERIVSYRKDGKK